MLNVKEREIAIYPLWNGHTHNLHTLIMINTLILLLVESLITRPNKMEASEELVRSRAIVLEAQEAARGRGVKLSPNSSVIKNYKALLPSVLPLNVFSQILGHMLGDCAIKYDASSNQASLTFEWGNKAYAEFVYNALYYYVLSPPRVQVRKNQSGNLVTTYCFQTVKHPSFAVFKDLFYHVDKSAIKTVPVGLITSLLTPLALAIWFMDDGGQTDYRTGHGKGIQFNTQGFTPEVVAQMVKELNDKFNLDCWMRLLANKGGRPIIVLPSKSYARFCDLVKPHMDKSMMHKLP